MKRIFFLMLTVMLIIAVAHAQKRTFLRLYSLADHKFQKGHFSGTTDSSISIYRDRATIEIPAVNIGYIKIKRSIGHNMLVGALVGAIPLSILGATGGESKTNENTIGGVLHDALTFTPAEGAVTGLIAGGIAGAATGAVISAFSRSTTFIINGDISEWQQQKRIIDLLPAHK